MTITSRVIVEESDHLCSVLVGIALKSIFSVFSISSPLALSYCDDWGLVGHS